jgi:PAS domain S-box-containing protein
VALATELLNVPIVSVELAHHALERLRQRARAMSAGMWTVTNTTAQCVLHVGTAVEADHRSVTSPISDVVVERLRRHGALFCRSDETVGVEPMVPRGAQSFVVAVGPGPAEAFGVLVIGWETALPPCDETAAAQLRIAASLLERALTPHWQEQSSLSRAIVGSVALPIVVVNPEGSILATNAAWRALNRSRSVSAPVGPSDNYFAVWRHRATAGVRDAAAIAEGIRAVAAAESDFFQIVYACEELGATQWCVLTATPLDHGRGGAVVAHLPLAVGDVTQLAQRMSDKRFQGLADTIPLPIWRLAPDGRWIQGNQRWTKLVADERGNVPETTEWTDVFHPDDRARAVSALLTAAASGSPFEVELRIRNVDDTYYWALCKGAPQIAGNGRLEGFIGFCCDVTAQREAEWTLAEMAQRVVAAQEEERSRIGRELHDGLGQQAALLAVQLAALAHNPRCSRGDLRKGLIETERSLQELALAIHDLSHRLHPAKLKLLGLVNTLEALCRDLSREGSVPVRFAAADVPPDVPESVALCVFRVTQEALQNAVKHSGAQGIDLRLSASGSRLTLRVSDKGRGFDPLASEATGIGLLTMRERVELCGGTLTIDARPAGGTTIEANLPLKSIAIGSAAAP